MKTAIKKGLTHVGEDAGLGGGHLGDGYAVRRAAHVVHAQLLKVVHRVRVAAVLATHADLRTNE